MPQNSLDGIYIISIPTDDEIGPPPPGVDKDLDDLELEEIGRIEIRGNQIINLDPDNEELGELIDTTFRREGKKMIDKKTGGEVYVDGQIPMKNGEKGFARVFLDMLAFLDYWYERQE